ncbi:MAG: adenylate/guanylate cyclase domain-containing protein, partial [Rhodospirillales bacterium]|nr:adenylate/guanylate cyclase domain-containing protein [Rhodospirillales bacterium]
RKAAAPAAPVAEPISGLARITVSALMIGFASAAAITFGLSYLLRDYNAGYGFPSSVSDAVILVILFFILFAAITALSAMQLASTVARIPVVRSLFRSGRKAAKEPASSKPSAEPVKKATRTGKVPVAKGKQLSPEAKEQSQYLKTYLRDAVKPVRGAFDVKDPFIRFGINLFTVGTCEALCQQRQLDQDVTQEVMEACVRAIGVDKEQAASFSSNYVEYLVSDQRYMEMFSSGRQAIQNHMAGQAAADDALMNALHSWATPSALAEGARLVTIMFTHLANYEDLGAQLGENTAQEVLQAHNQIVERALLEFGGKRIKQIRNGIMAAFMDAAQAVRAAIAIRDRITDQNAANPRKKARVKIGLNSGEPVAEGNDLFGASVQLAARIMSAAEPGQVLVSKSVHDEVAQKTDQLSLKPSGSFTLKGFADPLPLYAATSEP